MGRWDGKDCIFSLEKYFYQDSIQARQKQLSDPLCQVNIRHICLVINPSVNKITIGKITDLSQTEVDLSFSQQFSNFFKALVFSL